MERKEKQKQMTNMYLKKTGRQKERKKKRRKKRQKNVYRIFKK